MSDTCHDFQCIDQPSTFCADSELVKQFFVKSQQFASSLPHSAFTQNAHQLHHHTSGLAPAPASRDDRSRDQPSPGVTGYGGGGGTGPSGSLPPMLNAMQRCIHVDAMPPSLLGEPGLRPETTDGTYSNALGNQALREPVKPGARNPATAKDARLKAENESPIRDRLIQSRPAGQNVVGWKFIKIRITLEEPHTYISRQLVRPLALWRPPDHIEFPKAAYEPFRCPRSPFFQRIQAIKRTRLVRRSVQATKFPYVSRGSLRVK